MSNVNVVAGLYEAFGAGDIEAVLGAMDEDIRWYEAESNPYMPSGEPFVGPEAILNNLFALLGADWEPFEVHPGSYHDAGEVVVVEARYKGQHKETGNRLDCQVCHVWTVKDGKITRFQQYVDTASLQAAMGA